MSFLKSKTAIIGAILGLLGLVIGFTGPALASGISSLPVVVMFTRLNGITTMYPQNDALSLGSTTAMTPQGSVSALQVVLNYTGFLNSTATTTYPDAFDVASTTATGSATTTTDLFRVNSAGCVNMFATSTATAVKLLFAATTTNITAPGGIVEFSYGKCSG